VAAAPSAMDPSWQFRSPSLTCRNTMITSIVTGSAAVWIRGRRLPEARADCERLIELMPRGTMIVDTGGEVVFQRICALTGRMISGIQNRSRNPREPIRCRSIRKTRPRCLKRPAASPALLSPRGPSVSISPTHSARSSRTASLPACFLNSASPRRPRHGLDVMGVGDDQLERAFQHPMDRLPVNPGTDLAPPARTRCRAAARPLSDGRPAP
jgi:hypothetical protein